jgi:hypothetical protein
MQSWTADVHLTVFPPGSVCLEVRPRPAGHQLLERVLGVDILVSCSDHFILDEGLGGKDVDDYAPWQLANLKSFKLSACRRD